MQLETNYLHEEERGRSKRTMTLSIRYRDTSKRSDKLGMDPAFLVSHNEKSDNGFDRTEVVDVCIIFIQLVLF